MATFDSFICNANDCVYVDLSSEKNARFNLPQLYFPLTAVNGIGKALLHWCVSKFQRLCKHLRRQIKAMD